MTDDDGWPAALRGVTESLVATRGPDDGWSVAALGLHAPDEGDDGAVTAVTWGDTRTRRGFDREGGGVVQFPTDPRDVVDAALSTVVRDEPVLESAAAWARVEAERVAAGEEGGTRWRRWRLDPVEHGVRERRVPTVNRGFNAVVDATVAASRLGVPSYDRGALVERLEHLASVVESCGGPAEREAFARIDEYADWREER